ncbi:MAG: signal peptidase I [Bacillota bacterium]
MKKFLNVFNIAVTIILVLVISAAAFLAFSARFSGDKMPSVAGHKVLTVLSGSMEPAIHTGDVIIIRPLAPDEQVKEGDVITFRTREKADMLITHRVMGIVSVNGVPKAYVTKGDANDSHDLSTVAREQVVGVYQWRVPYFGYFSDLLRKPFGIIAFVVLPGVILIGHELIKIYKILAEAEAAKVGGGGDQPKA